MEIIDRGAWPREGHYRFFAPMSQPFYSLTFPVDVTALRAIRHLKKMISFATVFLTKG